MVVDFDLADHKDEAVDVALVAVLVALVVLDDFDYVIVVVDDYDTVVVDDNDNDEVVCIAVVVVVIIIRLLLPLCVPVPPLRVGCVCLSILCALRPAQLPTSFARKYEATIIRWTSLVET